MPSMISTLVCGALLAGAVVAAAPTTNFSSADIQKAIREVSLTDRNSWCDGQTTACGNLCAGQTSNNSCAGATLEWSCTCMSNNSMPGLQYYTPTLYSNLCNQVLGDCLKEKAGDRASQDACKTMYVCGTLNASSAAAAASTSSASATPSATGTASTAPSSTPTRSAALAIRFGERYGAGVLGALVVGALGVAL